MTQSDSHQLSPRATIERNQSSESNDNNGGSQEQEDVTQQPKNNNKTNMPMHDILKIIEHGNISTLFENR